MLGFLTCHFKRLHVIFHKIYMIVEMSITTTSFFAKSKAQFGVITPTAIDHFPRLRLNVGEYQESIRKSALVKIYFFLIDSGRIHVSSFEPSIQSYLRINLKKKNENKII